MAMMYFRSVIVSMYDTATTYTVSILFRWVPDWSSGFIAGRLYSLRRIEE
jgi:hypothetical protein